MKKLFLFILVVALCCALCACGKGGNKSSKEIEYDTAIAELRGLIAVSVPESKLKDPSYVYNREIEGEKWGPIFVFSPELGELYKKFSEFGDYKQSKEILERFTVLENSYVVVDEVKVDLLGNEQKNEGVSRHTFDAQKRYICSNMRNTKIYDDDGNLVREDANTIHFYNDQGQRVETREYLDGLVDSIIEYVYDEKGNCVQEITKRIEGTHTKTYSYDENGRRISETTEGGTVTYVYDEYGNRIERDEKYSRIYDENNNFLIETCVDSVRKNHCSVYLTSGTLIETFMMGSADVTVVDYEYENGMPLRVSFSDGSYRTYRYESAYFFDFEGLELPEN